MTSHSAVNNPAFAGMTSNNKDQFKWIPAFAGMTAKATTTHTP
ncbi:MAG TPA: hypothetical protein VJ484_10790 [Lysobacter sp.]|nr:hypothetical protein [Lysobacter sp.]